MIVILLGPQGSGKGTQAMALRERLGMVHIASGDVLREARRSGTSLGNQATEYMDKGELVPDSIIIGLLTEAIRAHAGAAGLLLDGFPRTVPQAAALDAALKADGRTVGRVVELVAPLEVVRERLQGRLLCRTCSAVYNTRSKPPRRAGVCDIDGGELYQREDDYPEAIDRRLAIWARENSQLTAYYGSKGLLVRVDADRPPEVVTDDIVSSLPADASVTGR